MVLALLFHLPHLFIWKILVNTYDFVTIYIGIKYNFVSVAHLHVSWLNFVEVEGGVHCLYQRFIVSALSHESSTLSFCLLYGILYYMLVRNII